jgi:hypothetical protein
MSLTMIFGSMVAGATSEGGGAVAFPVMTLALKIPPSIARDFSLMTQSCGKKNIYIVNKTNKKWYAQQYKKYLKNSQFCNYFQFRTENFL